MSPITLSLLRFSRPLPLLCVALSLGCFTLPLSAQPAAESTGRVEPAESVAPGAEEKAAQEQAAQKLKKPVLNADLPVKRLKEVVVSADAAPTSYHSRNASSATRFSEPVLDTPRSVQVVTRPLLEDRAVNDPQEAVQNVSGVQRSASFTGVGETYLLRGFRQETLVKDGFRAGSSPGGSTFSAVAPTDMANLQQVEVLKGPAALLYGRGEPGGVVNYITRTPTFDNRYSVEQQFGSHDFYRTQIEANMNVVPSKFAFRVDGAFDTTGSYLDHVEGERLFVAPSFLWKITEDTTLTFKGEYNGDERSTIPGLPYINGSPAADIPYHRYFGEDDFTEVNSQSWRGLLTLDHRWNEEHKTTLSLHGLTTDSEGGYFILFNFLGPTIDPLSGDVARAAAVTDFNEDYTTARLEHVWDWTLYDGGSSSNVKGESKATEVSKRWSIPSVKNQFSIAGEYDWQRNENLRYLSGHTPLNGAKPHYTGYKPSPLLPFPGYPQQLEERSLAEATASSLILMDRLSFGETVYLTYGGRFEWFDADNSLQYPEGAVFSSSRGAIENEYTYNPSYGLVIKPARNVSLYGSYSESTFSFKNIGAFTASGETLEPERATQLEAGVKVEFLDGKLYSSVAAFEIEKTDVAGTDPSNPLFSINAGEERSQGVEWEVGGEPLPGWRITANYTYLDARITSDPLQLNVGHRRYGAPENSGGAFSTYEIQDGFLKGFGFGGGVYLCDQVEVDNANSGNLSGWAQTDAVMFYKRDRFRAQLNLKNAFDSEYYYSQDSATTVQAGAGRMLVGSIKYTF